MVYNYIVELNSNRANVSNFPGSWWNVDHRSNATILQDCPPSGLLAVVQPVLQRPGELHQPQCQLPHRPTTPIQLSVAYFSATFSALGTAIGLKKALEKSSSKLLQRFVPFAAVASANFVGNTG